MSLGVGHFMVGATFTTLLLWVVWPGSRYSRSITAFGGSWAMVPDVGKLEPFATPQVLAFHDSPVANVFWGHQFLDVLDAGDSAAFAGATVAVFLVVSVVTEASVGRFGRNVRDAHTPESERLARRVTALLAVWLRRVVALGAMGMGGVLALLPFFVESRFAGVLVGTGAMLGLFGLEVLDEDAALVALAGRAVPKPVRVSARVGVSVLAGIAAAVLLSHVLPLTGLSVPYGALGFVLLALLLRLWLPSRVRGDPPLDTGSGDRAW